ncbi:sel1 repeat family protein [Butyrivibrio sp. AE3004]|uniref:sel1 repeat family protein n=1 Tax=Butyrivibrio sp. AE3004 TaxID=1506994 RepID=UPI000494924E|nr:sel1 repeat family protein [Butyrivibrio sp. AE3004]
MYDANDLKAIVRFEVNPALFETDTENEEFYNVDNYRGTYRPSYQDLRVACENMLKAGTNAEMFQNWYCFVSNDLADCYEGMWTFTGDNGYLWPNNDYDQFKAMDNAINNIGIYIGCYEEEIKSALLEIIQMADNYEFNRNHEPVDWKLTKSQIEEILQEFIEDTAGVSNSRRELFRKIINEECDAENPLAMRIKGYGCYGGDKVFDCDWDESRKLITKLFELDGNPYYANTLGYIYYYGRCNEGVPEYEKAFQYFSIGFAHDVIESMYKIADMFLAGKGCIKSPETSAHIIHKLYYGCRPDFCMGDDAKFADVALRMAAHYQRNGRYSEAFYHYLEADYAIKKRLKKSDFFGDKKVQDNITKSIAEVKQHLEPGFFKDKEITRNPYWLFDMIDRECKSKIEISHINENRYRIKVIRPKGEDVGKAMVVAPELERVTLTRAFASEFTTDEPIAYECKDKFNMYVDNIKYCDENTYSFCMGDKVIFIIKNANYILTKNDFEKV